MDVEEPPQAITLEKVLMTAPCGPMDNKSSAPSTTPVNANATKAPAAPMVMETTTPPASELVFVTPMDEPISATLPSGYAMVWKLDEPFFSLFFQRPPEKFQ